MGFKCSCSRFLKEAKWFWKGQQKHKMTENAPQTSLKRTHNRTQNCSLLKQDFRKPFFPNQNILTF